MSIVSDDLFIPFRTRIYDAQCCISRWTYNRGSLVCGYESKGSNDFMPGLVRRVSKLGERAGIVISESNVGAVEAEASISVEDNGSFA